MTKSMVAAGARNAGLDYLRTLCICIVLANHGFLIFFVGTGKVQISALSGRLSASAVISIEWLFVLSGYLIGTMMIRSYERPGSWLTRTRDFWLRRWFRTIPNYYLFLGVNTVLALADVATGQFHWSFAIFSQNLYQPEPTPHFFGEAWSLALDEWFYLLMPLLIGLAMWGARAGVKRSFVSTAVLLIVLPMAARAMHGVPTNFFVWDDNIRRVTMYHLDATGWGVLAAAANRWYKPWWDRRRGWTALAGGCLTVAGLAMLWRLVDLIWEAGVWSRTMSVFSLTLMDAGGFLMLSWLTRLPVGKGIFESFVARTSLYSYSIYLCHFPLLFITRHVLPMSDGRFGMGRLAVVTAAWLVAVYVVAALVFHGFEKPISDLRERFTRRVSTLPF